jgi:hypothetical protein
MEFEVVIRPRQTGVIESDLIDGAYIDLLKKS